ncbi:MAG: hypothetical protein RID91_19050 [Azospirillaceae bacterium]
MTHPAASRSSSAAPASVVADSLSTAALGDNRARGPVGETTLSTLIAAGAYHVVLGVEEAIRRLRRPIA